jgi:hypothetical protein
LLARIFQSDQIVDAGPANNPKHRFGHARSIVAGEEELCQLWHRYGMPRRWENAGVEYQPRPK